MTNEPFEEAAVRVGTVVIADVAAKVIAAALLNDVGPLINFLLEVTLLQEAMFWSRLDRRWPCMMEEWEYTSLAMA